MWVSDVISGIAPCRKIGERGHETKTKQKLYQNYLHHLCTILDN